MHWIPETWKKLKSLIVSVDKVEREMCAEDILRISNNFGKQHLSRAGGIIGVGSDYKSSLVTASCLPHSVHYMYFPSSNPET